MLHGYFIQNYYALKWIQESSKNLQKLGRMLWCVFFCQFCYSQPPLHLSLLTNNLHNLWELEVLQVFPHLRQHLLVPYWQPPKHKCTCFPISVSPAAHHDIEWRIDMIKEIALLKGKHPCLKTMRRDCRWVGAISQFI